MGQQCFDGDNFSFCSLRQRFTYRIPMGKQLVSEYKEYIDSFPADDSPEIFGLHSNADLTYGSATAAKILATILDTQL